MGIIKKITALAIVAVILACNLPGCGSNDAEDIANEPASTEEILPTPETYEDYMKLAADSYDKQDWETTLAYYQGAKELDESRQEAYRGISDTYLQMDDVMLALAILDEGMEKCSDKHGIDLIGQRKSYLLPNVVAICTKTTEYQYEDDGSISSGEIKERDRNGNEIKDTAYRAGGELSRVIEYEYDATGNQISRHSTMYESDGSKRESYGWVRACDENGNETECVYYDKNGDIEKRSEYEYDENGRQTKYIEYDKDGRVKSKTQTEYDSYGNVVSEIYDTESIKSEYDGRGNEIRVTRYDSAGEIMAEIGKEYDESDHQTKYTKYDENGNIVEEWEREYDGNGNLTKYVHNDGVSVDDSWESKYDENGNEIKRVGYDSEGNISYIQEYGYNANGAAVKFDRIIFGADGSEDVCEWTYEYDEAGREIGYETIFHDNKGNISFHHKRESEYTDYGNRVRYYEITENPEGSDGYAWDRAYDEKGNEIMFCLYDDKEELSYRSVTEYNENGLEVRYTGYGEDGSILTFQETEYDIYGNLVRKDYYDADENLLWYYVKEYDEFGNVTLQSMYEGDVLRSEEKIEYAYRYIGDMNADAPDLADPDMPAEELNRKQRDIFMRFLEGQEKIRYCNDYNCIADGRIVDDRITDLLDFSYYDWLEVVSEYAFWDMTGDGIEELVIRCSSSNLYVIQCDYGVLKVIQSAVGGNLGTYLVRNGERTGICCDFGGHVGGNEQEYYFSDQKGKTFIRLGDYQDFTEDGEETRSYSARVDNGFERYYDISEGEYYDIADRMIWIPDSCIDWYSLEDDYD